MNDRIIIEKLTEIEQEINNIKIGGYYLYHFRIEDNKIFLTFEKGGEQ